jgi:glycosyltransferase involved in cell wall biosynthesis
MKPYAATPARATLSRARRLLSPVPLISRGYSPVMGELVAEAARRSAPDAVHLVSMYSCRYRLPGLPAVIDLLDVVSGLCEAAASARPLRYGASQLQRLTSQRLEIRELAGMAAVLAINDEDAERLRRLGLRPDVVPLAVTPPSDERPQGASDDPLDAAALSSVGPSAALHGVGHADRRGATPLELLFVGNFAHQPNRAAANFILHGLVPALEGRGVACRVTIAGRRADVVARGGREGLRAATASCRLDGGHDSAPKTRVTYVPDPPDLAPLYRRTDIVIAPVVYGGGTKNKTLEAMAWGKPVVGTPSAFSGVAARQGEAFLSAPLDGAAMAAAVGRLVADRAFREAVGRAGRDYVLRCHSQRLVDERVAQVYERVLAALGRPSSQVCHTW